MESRNQFIHYIILRLGYPIASIIIKLVTHAFDQNFKKIIENIELKDIEE